MMIIPDRLTQHWWNPKISNGISLICACRNRNENLSKAVTSWLAHSNIDEIIIIDWGSDHQVDRYLDSLEIFDRRIIIARVENTSGWVLSQAFNLGFRLACRSKILKIDADIILSSEFFRLNELKENCFLSGNWRTADEGQAHINGSFFAHLDQLRAINGFNENIKSYGWEDADLYERLSINGTRQSYIDPKTLHHLSHTDDERIQLNKKPISSAYFALLNKTDFHIARNEVFAKLMPHWGEDNSSTSFAVLDQFDRHIFLTVEIEGTRHLIECMFEYATCSTMAKYIAWQVGSIVYELDETNFKVLLHQHSLGDIDQQTIESLLQG